MRPIACLVLTATVLLPCFFCPAKAAASPGDMGGWLKDFRREALAAGVSLETLERTLAELEKPVPAVIDHDRNQPERTQTSKKYVADRVNRTKIEDGRQMMRRYPTWLGRVEREFEVQKRFVVALWGIESHYGEETGRYPVIRALATLARDDRRGNYFRKELIEALLIIDAGQAPGGELEGSWAGALGQCQFMPSSYRRYAVNADGGRLDIWTSVPDVLASIANYLEKAGWKDDQTWGRPVRLPKNFDRSLAGMENRLPLSRWQALGVRRTDGTDLPRRDLDASLILPDGPEGPAFLVYDNFRTLLSWNRSISFAIAVGTLSDRLQDVGNTSASLDQKDRKERLIMGLAALFFPRSLAGR